jgi:hypothetical protein
MANNFNFENCTNETPLGIVLGERVKAVKNYLPLQRTPRAAVEITAPPQPCHLHGT